MTNQEIDFSEPADVLTRWAKARAWAVAVSTSLLLLTGTGVAVADPAAVADGVPLGETVTLTEQYGTATAWAEHYVLGIRVHATVTDTRSDSRCAYVHYKIDASGWSDPDGKVVRVCGDGRSDTGVVEWVGPTWSSARDVEVRVCREQGFGDDPCGPVQVLTL